MILIILIKMINDDDDEEEEKNEDFNSDKFKEQLISLKKRKKKFIIIFSTLGVLLLAIIITVIVFIFYFKVEGKEKEQEKQEEKIEILAPLIYEPSSGKHIYSIIFTPGFSNQPEDYRKTFEQKINFDKKNETKIIILRSPLKYVTAVNSTNYSWFDIYTFPITSNSDYNFEELKNSAKILEKMVDNEAKILNGKYENIIIGGHSQGAFLSLYHGYNTNKNLGGLFAFSGVLPPGEISKNKNNFKVYYGYGDKDDVINPSFMLGSIERVRYFDAFDLHLYENHTHHVNSKEKSDASAFLNNIIK